MATLLEYMLFVLFSLFSELYKGEHSLSGFRFILGKKPANIANQ